MLLFYRSVHTNSTRWKDVYALQIVENSKGEERGIFPVTQYSHEVPAINHDKPKREQQAPRRYSNQLHTNLALQNFWKNTRKTMPNFSRNYSSANHDTNQILSE